MRHLISWAIIFAITTGACHAADSGKDILRRSLDLSAAIRDYSADLVVVMDLPNLQVPRRTAKVYYKRPNKVAIKSRGIVMIPKRALMPGNLGTEITKDSQVLIIGKNTVAGKLVYALKVIPNGKRVDERVLVWVRADRYTVERMEVYDGAAKELAVDWTYQLIGGKYWMPQTIKAHIYEWRAQGDANGNANGAGSVSVTFSNLTVNTGLPDSLFKEQKK